VKTILNILWLVLAGVWLAIMQVGLLFTPPILAYVFSENDGTASHRKGG
jgi:hypothetical protein